MIGNRTVFSKTGKGLLEIKSRSTRLPRDQTRLLSLVDGKLNLGELAAQNRIPEDDARKIVTLLCEAGYIKELVASADESKPRLADSTGPSVSDGDDDLDFTRILNEPAPAKALMPNAESVVQRGEAHVRAQAEQQRARDEARAQPERQHGQNQAHQRQTEAQAPARPTPVRSYNVAQPPDSNPTRDLDAELRGLKRAQEELSTPVRPEQPAAPAGAAELPRPAPVKADLYAAPDVTQPQSDRSPKDMAEALARARQEAAQRARDEAIRLQQDAKERRMRAPRKPK